MASDSPDREGGAEEGPTAPSKSGCEAGGDSTGADLLATLAASSLASSSATAATKHTSAPAPAPAATPAPAPAPAPAPTKRKRDDEVAAESGDEPATKLTDEKERHPCRHAGCNYVASHRRYITEHMRTHTGCKPYGCAWPGCGYASTGSGHLSAWQHPSHDSTVAQSRCLVH